MKKLSAIWIAPAPGSGGVGDYASELEPAIRELGVDLSVLYLAPPLAARAADVASAARRVRREVDAARRRGPTIVHGELSAGSIESYWAMPSGDPLVTATIHDPPHIVWWPLYVRAVARHRLLHHAIHYPIRKAWWAWEDRRLGLATHFALTDRGERSLRKRGLLTYRLRHHIPRRSGQENAPHRAHRSIGLFGYAYGGKGFELLAGIRKAVPPDIGIHVAGRGTDQLRVPAEVTSWGEIAGEREDAFFERIDCLLLPYEGGGRYGEFYSASGAAARAFAYGVPVVAPPVRSFSEEAEFSPATILANSGSAEALAAAASALVADDSRLAESVTAARNLKGARTPQVTAKRMVEVWEGLLLHCKPSDGDSCVTLQDDVTAAQ